MGWWRALDNGLQRGCPRPTFYTKRLCFRSKGLVNFLFVVKSHLFMPFIVLNSIFSPDLTLRQRGVGEPRPILHVCPDDRSTLNLRVWGWGESCRRSQVAQQKTLWAQEQQDQRLLAGPGLVMVTQVKVITKMLAKKSETLTTSELRTLY